MHGSMHPCVDVLMHGSMHPRTGRCCNARLDALQHLHTAVLAEDGMRKDEVTGDKGRVGIRFSSLNWKIRGEYYKAPTRLQLASLTEGDGVLLAHGVAKNDPFAAFFAATLAWRASGRCACKNLAELEARSSGTTWASAAASPRRARRRASFPASSRASFRAPIVLDDRLARGEGAGAIAPLPLPVGCTRLDRADAHAAARRGARMYQAPQCFPLSGGLDASKLLAHLQAERVCALRVTHPGMERESGRGM